MKILIISNDEEKLCSVSGALENKGFDTIIYSDFLKAMDNFREISPNFCIINALNYPRHWKIFAQFIKSDLARAESSVILFAPTLSEEERKKADFLGIKGIFTETGDFGLEKLFNFLETTGNSAKTAQKTEAESKVRKPSLLAKIEALNNEKC